MAEEWQRFNADVQVWRQALREWLDAQPPKPPKREGDKPRKVTQGDFCTRHGLIPSQFSRIIRGRQLPNAEQWDTLTKVLGSAESYEGDVHSSVFRKRAASFVGHCREHAQTGARIVLLNVPTSPRLEQLRLLAGLCRAGLDVELYCARRPESPRPLEAHARRLAQDLRELGAESGELRLPTVRELPKTGFGLLSGLRLQSVLLQGPGGLLELWWLIEAHVPSGADPLELIRASEDAGWEFRRALREANLLTASNALSADESKLSTESQPAVVPDR